MKQLLAKIWKGLRQMRGPDIEVGQMWEYSRQSNPFTLVYKDAIEILEVRNDYAKVRHSVINGDWLDDEVMPHDWLRYIYHLKHEAPTH